MTLSLMFDIRLRFGRFIGNLKFFRGGQGWKFACTVSSTNFLREDLCLIMIDLIPLTSLFSLSNKALPGFQIFILYRFCCRLALFFGWKLNSSLFTIFELSTKLLPESEYSLYSLSESTEKGDQLLRFFLNLVKLSYGACMLLLIVLILFRIQS